jgi:hypothetical protein
MESQATLNRLPKTFFSDNTKLNLLKSVSDLILSPNNYHLKETLKHLYDLSDFYHIELHSSEDEEVDDINKCLMNGIAEIISNKRGYVELLPQMYGLVTKYAGEKELVSEPMLVD